VPRILYVEDNEDNVYMLKMRLELEDGFDVLVAGNGADGVALAAAERPDLVLMDLNLPIVDGWEATRRIKADAKSRDIPIIALTAAALVSERDEALRAGMCEFLTKPINAERLRSVLAYWVGRGRA